MCVFILLSNYPKTEVENGRNIRNVSVWGTHGIFKVRKEKCRRGKN